ncbi:hypothetical protein D3C75_1099370 [compost metagenome]
MLGESQAIAARAAEIGLQHPPALGRQNLDLAVIAALITGFGAAMRHDDERPRRSPGRRRQIGLDRGPIARLHGQQLAAAQAFEVQGVA